MSKPKVILDKSSPLAFSLPWYWKIYARSGNSLTFYIPKENMEFAPKSDWGTFIKIQEIEYENKV